jgi:cation diffusion facilitator CzcD-associated flavoprotein CzcO
MVCNGHYEVPNGPDLEGSEKWPGTIEHSHHYREPESKYRGKRVVLLGAASSGEDIARDVSSVVSQGFLVARKGTTNAQQ